MSGRRHGTPDGFTLLELVIAVSLTVVILGLSIGLLRFAAVAFRSSEERLDVRESASRALGALRESLTSCVAYVIHDQGARIQLLTPRSDGEARFAPETGELVLALRGQTRATRLISSGVTRFHVEELRPGFLRVTLHVARPRPLAPLTVVEELFIPAAARGDGSIPWSDPTDRPRS